MLRNGIAIKCRTPEELAALREVILREGYKWRGGEYFDERTTNTPVRISFNIVTGNQKVCMSRAYDINFSLNPGITEAYEASDFLHNIIISMRLKKGE